MDADGSAERHGSACVGVDVSRADRRRRTDAAVACYRRGTDTRPRYGRKTDASRLQRPEERTAKEETMEESGERRGGTGDTEGTCYALRDMAEARGIHNFVKTKMLRSCLGGVAFFLVSRNVQARLFPSVLLVPSLLPAQRSLRPLLSFLPLHDVFSLSLSLSFVPLVSSLSELPRCIIPFSFLR